VTFFPPDPEPLDGDDVDSSRQPWWSPPEDEFPAVSPACEVIAVTDHVAIALVGVFAHRDGVAFRIERRLRRHRMPLREWTDLLATFAEHWPAGAQETAGRLRYGLVLGDGERVLEDSAFVDGLVPGAHPNVHTLTRNGRGGGGGAHSYAAEERLWLWPAPPPGPIDLVLQWPALGIGERRIRLDGDGIRDLMPRARLLWE
jgi:hypothetical protein